MIHPSRPANTRNDPTYAAAVAFYAMISLATVLTIALKVASLVFGEDVSKGQMLFQVEQFVGVQVTDLIETLLETTDTGSSGVFATILSVGVMIFGATALDCVDWHQHPYQHLHTMACA